MNSVEELEVIEKAEAKQPLQKTSADLGFENPPIFATVLLESGGLRTGRRGLATLVSFLVQCFVIAIALLVPLMYTDVLPTPQLLTMLEAPPPPPPPPPAAAPEVVKVVRQSEISATGQLRTPSRIPQKVEMIKEEEAPLIPVSGGVVGGVPGGIPGGQLGGVIGGIISSSSNTAAVPKLAAVVPKRVRISQGVTKGLLIRKIEPSYPALARQARIQGEVILAAVIDKSGAIQDLKVVSGHPLLIDAALKAVEQWRYRPYLLNGEPVEVETVITVTFNLQY